MHYEDVRFLSSVSVISTFAFFFHLSEALSVHGTLFRPLAIFMTLSLYIWFTVFGQWISRARRATFNEQNLLLTYQPRAFTHGHLFVPDPPTPCRFSQTPVESCTDSDFRNARDAHYKDEFHRAMNMSTEKKMIPQEKVETMRIEFDQSSSPPSSPSNSGKSPNF
ncbi:hypothetical protein CRE_20312 [Caenorhabditis remanei]|uniref:Uncharacterized protein n=1 Tax=Caenorhabditis remanei TaxID=31234 RepID=E3MCP6_CAERE|nr:hypothetical protein CRE_20312 [Caenorhabditis remanei]